MPYTPLTIVSTTSFGATASALLAKETNGHVLVNNGDDYSTADVAFGQPDPQQVIDSARLRWVHITTAGYTRYDTPAVRTALQARGAVFTNSSHVYAMPCAQHM